MIQAKIIRQQQIRILCYPQGTKKLGINYVRKENNKFIGYIDNDYVDFVDDRKTPLDIFFA